MVLPRMQKQTSSPISAPGTVCKMGSPLITKTYLVVYCKKDGCPTQFMVGEDTTASDRRIAFRVLWSKWEKNLQCPTCRSSSTYTDKDFKSVYLDDEPDPSTFIL
jgi:hypothetical protein